MDKKPWSDAESVQLLQQLTHAFNLVAATITSKPNASIWLIHGIVGDGGPTLDKYESVEDVGQRLTELRIQQNADPENRYYAYIIRGTRWSILKGRTWKMWDGKNLMPIGGDNIEKFLDDSGSLLDKRDLDSVCTRPAPESVVSEDNCDENGVDIDTDEIEMEPHTVGEGKAPPGEDPAIE